jgi:hypothetical protein
VCVCVCVKRMGTDRAASPNTTGSPWRSSQARGASACFWAFLPPPPPPPVRVFARALVPCLPRPGLARAYRVLPTALSTALLALLNLNTLRKGVASPPWLTPPPCILSLHPVLLCAPVESPG